MFFGISELFESIKEESEALESQNVPMNDVVTQTVWSDTKLTEDEEKNYWRVDYDLIQDTRAITKFDDQIEKFKVLKSSYYQENFYENLICTMKDKKRSQKMN